MPATAIDPSLRPAGADDEEFLRALFLAGRPELDVLAGAPGGARLIDLQWAAQRAAYRDRHPDAVDHLILVGEEKVGRCWVHESGSELRVLDLAVTPTHRRRGIADSVLTMLCAHAQERGMSVRLSVWSANTPARALYAGCGFAVVDEQAGYLDMQWMPAAEPAPQPARTTGEGR